jgi:hypothetical protein
MVGSLYPPLNMDHTEGKNALRAATENFYRLGWPRTHPWVEQSFLACRPRHVARLVRISTFSHPKRAVPGRACLEGQSW